MRTQVRRLGRSRFVRYALVSLAALAVDMGVFLVLLKLAVSATLAAVLGYAAGILAHWLASSRMIFADRLAAKGAGRLRQQSGFLVSALVGLGVTGATVWLCGLAGWDARLSKLAAIVLSFQLTWLLRKHVVFRPIPRAI
ncbi:GtrA family protein [Novosphingobium sp. BW1]|uniref:GtrA family protein n=1 Tax=Novosphingobium sp. BW1 TaxID=2592621 RepID=UPI0011DEE39A|nr:GtrA family protein [Novosphingobium sp. BW1]TYC91673.1 GtrA family protein [Novosphingobium sp. BW1]